MTVKISQLPVAPNVSGTDQVELNQAGTSRSGTLSQIAALAGGGGGGHTIQDEGSSLPSRSALNFVGTGVTATDDQTNDRTIVTVPGAGSAGGLWIDITQAPYSAAGNGVTDDTQAFKDAVADIKASGKPGTIWIPPTSASYRIKEILIQPTVPITFRGDQSHIKMLDDVVADEPRMFRVERIAGITADIYGYYPRVTFIGLIVDSNRDGQSAWAGDFSYQHQCCIYATGDAVAPDLLPITVIDCDIRNTTGNGIGLARNSSATVERCRFYACFRGAITPVGNYVEIFARHCYSDDPLDTGYGMLTGLYMEPEPDGWGISVAGAMKRPALLVHVDDWYFAQGRINLASWGNTSDEVAPSDYYVDFRLSRIVVPITNRGDKVLFYHDTTGIAEVSDSLFYSTPMADNGSIDRDRTRVAGRNWRFTNCTFVAAHIDRMDPTSGLLTPEYYACVSLGEDGDYNHPSTIAAFENCSFRIDQSIVTAAAGLPVYGISLHNSGYDYYSSTLAPGFLPPAKIVRGCNFDCLHYPRNADLSLEPVVRRFDYAIWMNSSRSGEALLIEGNRAFVDGFLSLWTGSQGPLYLTLRGNTVACAGPLYDFHCNQNEPVAEFIVIFDEITEDRYNAMALQNSGGTVDRFQTWGNRTVMVRDNPTDATVTVSGETAWIWTRASNTYEGRLEGRPVTAGTVVFTASGGQSITDTGGTGALSGSVASGSESDINTIDYATGWYRLRWATPLGNSETVTVSYQHGNDVPGFKGDVAVLKTDRTQQWRCTATSAGAATWTPI